MSTVAVATAITVAELALKHGPAWVDALGKLGKAEDEISVADIEALRIEGDFADGLIEPDKD